jgi:hypothetical protein
LHRASDADFVSQIESLLSTLINNESPPLIWRVLQILIDAFAVSPELPKSNTEGQQLRKSSSLSDKSPPFIRAFDKRSFDEPQFALFVLDLGIPTLRRSRRSPTQ